MASTTDGLQLGIEKLKGSDKKEEADVSLPRSRASSETSTGSYVNLEESLLIPQGSDPPITVPHPTEPDRVIPRLGALLTTQLSQIIDLSMSSSKNLSSEVTLPQSQSRRLSNVPVTSGFSEGVLVSAPGSRIDSPMNVENQVELPVQSSLNVGEGSLVLGPELQLQKQQPLVKSISLSSTEKKEIGESTSLSKPPSESGQGSQPESPGLSEEVDGMSSDSDIPKSRKSPAKVPAVQNLRGDIPSALLDPNSRLQKRSKSLVFVEPAASQKENLPRIKYYSPQMVSQRLSQSALPQTENPQVPKGIKSRRNSTGSNISGFSDFEKIPNEHSPKEEESSPYQSSSSVGQVPAISSTSSLTESDLVTSRFELPPTWSERVVMGGLQFGLSRLSGFFGITPVTNPREESTQTNSKNTSPILVSHTSNPSDIPVELNLLEKEPVGVRGSVTLPLSRRLAAKTDSPIGVKVEAEFPSTSPSNPRSKPQPELVQGHSSTALVSSASAEKKENSESDFLGPATQEAQKDVLAALPILHLSSRLRERSLQRSSHSRENSPMLGNSPSLSSKKLSQPMLFQTEVDLTSMPKTMDGSQPQSRRSSIGSNISDFELLSNELGSSPHQQSSSALDKTSVTESFTKVESSGLSEASRIGIPLTKTPSIRDSQLDPSSLSRRKSVHFAPVSSGSIGSSPLLSEAPSRRLSQAALPKGAGLALMPEVETGLQSRRNSIGSNISGFDVSNENSPKEEGSPDQLSSPPLEPFMVIPSTGDLTELNLVASGLNEPLVGKVAEELAVRGSQPGSDDLNIESESQPRRLSTVSGVSDGVLVSRSNSRIDSPTGIGVQVESFSASPKIGQGYLILGPKFQSSIGSTVPGVNNSDELSPKEESPHQPPSPIEIEGLVTSSQTDLSRELNLVATGLSKPLVIEEVEREGLVIGSSRRGSDSFVEIPAAGSSGAVSQANSINNSPILVSYPIEPPSVSVELHLPEVKPSSGLIDRKTLSEESQLTQGLETSDPKLRPQSRAGSERSNSPFTMIEPTVRSESRASNKSDRSYVDIDISYQPDQESTASQESNSIHASRDKSPILTAHLPASESLTQGPPESEVKTNLEQIGIEETRARAQNRFNQHKFMSIGDVRSRLQAIQAAQSINSLGTQDEESAHYQHLLSQTQIEADNAISIAKKRFEECSFIPEKNMQLRQSAILAEQSKVESLTLTDDQRQVYTALLEEELTSVTALIEQEQRQQDQKRRHDHQLEQDKESQHDQELATQIQAEELATAIIVQGHQHSQQLAERAHQLLVPQPRDFPLRVQLEKEVSPVTPLVIYFQEYNNKRSVDEQITYLNSVVNKHASQTEKVKAAFTLARLCGC